MLEKAIAYLESIKKSGREVTEEDKNNAANIYARSFEEYNKIWEEIGNM